MLIFRVKTDFRLALLQHASYSLALFLQREVLMTIVSAFTQNKGIDYSEQAALKLAGGYLDLATPLNERAHQSGPHQTIGITLGLPKSNKRRSPKCESVSC